MMMMLMMPMNWGIWRHCEPLWEKIGRKGWGGRGGMSVISQISDQASPPITDLRRSGVTGSGECGGGGGSFGPRSIRQRRKKKEKSIIQCSGSARENYTHAQHWQEKKNRDHLNRVQKSGTEIGYKNRVQKYNRSLISRRKNTKRE